MLKVYAVFDSKAASFQMPIFCSTDGLAVRGFSDALARQDSPVRAHHSDYSLYRLGEYEPNSGLLTGLPQPVFVISASSVIRSLEEARRISEPVFPAVAEVLDEAVKASEAKA